MNKTRKLQTASIAAACAFLSLPMQSGNGAASAASRHMYKGHISQTIVAADRLLTKGKYQAAADHYQAALKRNPNDSNAAVGFGLALTKLFKLDGA
jgi:Flp pilus assembly protein TadD